jgi:hypothetical protein
MKVITIGRDATNDIQLPDDPHIKRSCHCQFIQENDDTYYIVNFSQNSTFINNFFAPYGIRVKLNEYDIVRVGRGNALPWRNYFADNSSANFLTIIVNKIILGITEWTAEELQYQISNPEEIEKALSVIKKSVQNEKTEMNELRNAANDIVIVPSYFNILQRKAAKEAHEKKGFKCTRILTATNAVALALYAGKKIDLLRVAILILEKDTVDISIVEIGDGVFEVKCVVGNENTGNLITELCNNALHCTGLNKNNIDEFIITGNSAYNSEYQQIAENVFGKTARKMPNLSELLAKGADIQHGILIGNVKDVLLLDVIPMSLGIETEGGVMLKLIEANTIIPTQKTKTFTTVVANQPFVEIHILQGEKTLVKDNVTVGRFHLDGIHPASKSVSQIKVTFEIGANGDLGVSVKDKETGKEISVKVN